MRNSLYLVGMPGAGKSRLGAALADRLARPFLDLDAHLVERLGPIRAYFEAYGEAAFREEERDALFEVSASGGRVIATGGGIVLREENIHRMRQTGTVFWIRREISEILRDLKTAHRPLLAEGDPAERLRLLEAEREACYRAAAHYTIENNGDPERAIARMLGCLDQPTAGE